LAPLFLAWSSTLLGVLIVLISFHLAWLVGSQLIDNPGGVAAEEKKRTRIKEGGDWRLLLIQGESRSNRLTARKEIMDNSHGFLTGY
jgi:hypothetical protein